MSFSLSMGSPIYSTDAAVSPRDTKGVVIWEGSKALHPFHKCINHGGGEVREAIYTASLDLGNKIALPNQGGQDVGLCKLITGLFKIEDCQGSILGGGGGIGNAALVLCGKDADEPETSVAKNLCGGGGIGNALALCDVAADVLGTCDIAADVLDTCDIAADVLGTCDIAAPELGTCDIGGETTAT